MGKLIRDSLDAALSAMTHDAERDPLFEDAVYDGPAPTDGAAHHDRYLYDEN